MYRWQWRACREQAAQGNEGSVTPARPATWGQDSSRDLWDLTSSSLQPTSEGWAVTDVIYATAHRSVGWPAHQCHPDHCSSSTRGPVPVPQTEPCVPTTGLVPMLFSGPGTSFPRAVHCKSYLSSRPSSNSTSLNLPSVHTPRPLLPNLGVIPLKLTQDVACVSS